MIMVRACSGSFFDTSPQLMVSRTDGSGEGDVPNGCVEERQPAVRPPAKGMSAEKAAENALESGWN